MCVLVQEQPASVGATRAIINEAVRTNGPSSPDDWVAHGDRYVTEGVEGMWGGNVLLGSVSMREWMVVDGMPAVLRVIREEIHNVSDCARVWSVPTGGFSYPAVVEVLDSGYPWPVFQRSFPWTCACPMGTCPRVPVGGAPGAHTALGWFTWKLEYGDKFLIGGADYNLRHLFRVLFGSTGRDLSTRLRRLVVDRLCHPTDALILRHTTGPCGEAFWVGATPILEIKRDGDGMIAYNPLQIIWHLYDALDIGVLPGAEVHPAVVGMLGVPAPVPDAPTAQVGYDVLDEDVTIPDSSSDGWDEQDAFVLDVTDVAVTVSLPLA